MRKLTTTSILILFASICFAQKQQKEVYQPDTSKLIDVHFKVSINALSGFITAVNKGPQNLSQSKEFTAFDVTQILFHYKAISDSIAKPFNKYLLTDFAKFQADTLKKYHPDTAKKVKPKTKGKS